jgi:metal iron transporter
MPHALFLGSHLASVDRLNMLPRPPSRKPVPKNNRLPSLNPLSVLRRRRTSRACAEGVEDGEVELRSVSTTGRSTGVGLTCVAPEGSSRPDLHHLESNVGKDDDDDKDDQDYTFAMKRYEADIRAFDRIRWVDLHVWHATADTAYSLLGFALTINSAILTLAAAVFYYGDSGANPDDADLAGAHALIKSYIGNSGGIIFALALLCAGQSASITATLAGQVVSEGFLEWRTSPMIRRLVTRLIGVIPAATVASAVGNKGLDDMLVASQVVLCIVLPTVLLPLVYICSRKDIMCVDGPVDEATPVPVQNVVERENVETDDSDDRSVVEATAGEAARQSPSPSLSPPARRKKVYASPMWVTVLGYALCSVVILANGYVIVELALGRG